MPELQVRRTRGDKVIHFIQHYCRHTIGELSGELLLLEDWQKDFLRDFYAEYWDERRERWTYLYQSAVLGVPRGAGKSTLAAAVCLAELAPMPWATDAPRILISAVSRENAMQVYGPAADMVNLSEGQHDLRDLMMANKNVIWCDENRGEIRRVSADGKGQFGHIPSLVVRDELHAWVADKHISLSEALQTALAKRWNSRSLSVTTAGHDKQTILGRLYDESLKSAYREDPRPGCILVRDIERRFLMHWFAATEEMAPELPETWKAAHPASWIDEDAVRAQLNDPSIGMDEFRRQWTNVWTKSKSAWFEIGVWERNGPPKLPALEIPKDARIYCAVDGAWSDDCTALVWAWQQEDDAPLVIRSHVWGTREDLDGQYHTFVPGGTMDMELVRDKIKGLSRLYQVREVAYDPKFFTDTAKRLGDDGFTMVEFPRSGAVYDIAVTNFYRAVNSGMLRHDGDTVLASHIESTAAVQTEGAWKLFKLRQSRKIDACVAALMAAERCRLATADENTKYAFVSKRRQA